MKALVKRESKPGLWLEVVPAQEYSDPYVRTTYTNRINGSHARHYHLNDIFTVSRHAYVQEHGFLTTQEFQRDTCIEVDGPDIFHHSCCVEDPFESVRYTSYDGGNYTS